MPLKNLNILLVEDNKWNRDIAIDLLTDSGANVECVNNGQEAVDRLSPDPSKCGFDVILMDIDMPVLNGYEATKIIRQMEKPGAKNIPIIAMTAYAFEEDKQSAFQAGMNAHVAKPVKMDILTQTIIKVLGR